MEVNALGIRSTSGLVSAYSWLSDMGQGIAYGSIVGLPGREDDLAKFGSRALTALTIAGFSEALAIGAVAWVFSAHESLPV